MHRVIMSIDNLPTQSIHFQHSFRKHWIQKHLLSCFLVWIKQILYQVEILTPWTIKASIWLWCGSTFKRHINVDFVITRYSFLVNFNYSYLVSIYKYFRHIEESIKYLFHPRFSCWSFVYIRLNSWDEVAKSIIFTIEYYLLFFLYIL